MYLAYLAGPITGCSFNECVDWREDFIKKMPPEIIGLSPMRGKFYLEGLEKIDDSYQESDNHELKNIISGSRGIITRDFNDCKRADALVVNFTGATRVSIGTVMEVAWAKAFNIPVIVIMEPTGNIHEHSMLQESTGFRVQTPDQALEVLKMLLLPCPHRKN